MLQQRDPELGSLIQSLLCGFGFNEDQGPTTIERAARVDAASAAAKRAVGGGGPPDIEQLRASLPTVRVPNKKR
jgi:hypothetical protein